MASKYEELDDNIPAAREFLDEAPFKFEYTALIEKER